MALRIAPVTPTRRSPIVGCISGGQLVRLGKIDCLRKGLPFLIRVYCGPSEQSAAQVVDETVFGRYDDFNSILSFAGGSDVITVETENLDREILGVIERAKSWERSIDVHVRPSLHALTVCQHRLLEKQFIRSCGFQTAPFIEARKGGALSHRDIDKVLCGGRGYLKTCLGGFDGRGQVTVWSAGDVLAHLCKEETPRENILEGHVDMTEGGFEASVIVARGASGKMAAYPMVVNEHENGILRTTTWFPGAIAEDLEDEARKIAMGLANALQIIGLLAVEFFVTYDPIDECHHLVVNELAPRPHNSGHWTLDGCKVSQFENWLRAICGMEVLDPEPHHACVMVNLLGEEVRNVATLEAEGYSVYDYGKGEARPGRKMGHFTELRQPVILRDGRFATAA